MVIGKTTVIIVLCLIESYLFNILPLWRIPDTDEVGKSECPTISARHLAISYIFIFTTILCCLQSKVHIPQHGVQGLALFYQLELFNVNKLTLSMTCLTVSTLLERHAVVTGWKRRLQDQIQSWKEPSCSKVEGLKVRSGMTVPHGKMVVDLGLFVTISVFRLIERKQGILSVLLIGTQWGEIRFILL